MNAETACAIAESMADAWNARDLDAYLAYLTDDIVWNDPAMPEPARGREAVQRFSRSVLHAFPDFHYTVRQPICVAADGTRCVVPWRIEATHLQPLQPPGYGPTGLKATFDGVDLLEFRNEQVSRIETYFNVLIPAEQLLALRLRPAPDSWRERLAVAVQRTRARWLRATRRGGAYP